MARKRRRTGRRPPIDPMAQQRAFEALNLMRRTEGLSLTRAAEAAQTTPRTIRKYVGRALIRRPSGRYAATPSDRLTRSLRLITRDGTVDVGAIRIMD